MVKIIDRMKNLVAVVNISTKDLEVGSDEMMEVLNSKVYQNHMTTLNTLIYAVNEIDPSRELNMIYFQNLIYIENLLEKNDYMVRVDVEIEENQRVLVQLEAEKFITNLKAVGIEVTSNSQDVIEIIY